MKTKWISLLLLALASPTAQALQIIGDPDVQVNGKLTQTVTSTGYTSVYTLLGLNDPGNGATRFGLSNPVSGFFFNAYGSTAPGSLAGAAGLFATGSRLAIGGGINTPVSFFANNQYLSSAGHLFIATDGNIGIGTSTPPAKLSVEAAGTGYTSIFRARGLADPGNGATRFEVSNPQAQITVNAYGSGAPGLLANAGGLFGTGSAMLIGGGIGTPLKLFANNAFSSAHMVIDTQGNIGIGTASPTTKLDVAGEAAVDVINIRGGSDLSEQFQITGATGRVEPGMVVCIDPERPGELIISGKAYDRTVAGIISGAGGLRPGMMMGQIDHPMAHGKYPVALTGRVYCWVDATAGAIEPGDLLTTSMTPGHAMKVLDFTHAHGAILGKAMTSLPEGQGLVLVLVTLQ